MHHTLPLCLSERQSRRLNRACSLLPEWKRDNFMHAALARLDEHRHLTDRLFDVVIYRTLAHFGVSARLD